MGQDQLIRHSRTWDFGGVFITILCLIHCLFLPASSAFLPHLNFLDKNPQFEFLLFFSAIFIGVFSLTTSFYKHRKIYPMILGFLGLTLLIFGVVNTWNQTSALHNPITETLNPLTVSGSFFLISGHLWNIHSCHCFCSPKCTHKEHQKS